MRAYTVPYYATRRAIVWIADAVVEWADRTTRRAYAIPWPGLQRLARRACQQVGGWSRLAALLPRLDCFLLPTDDGEVVYIGDVRLLDELRMSLGSTAPPRASGRVAAWDLPGEVAAWLERSALVVCGLPPSWPRRWRPRGFCSFTVPVFVGFEIPTEVDVDMWMEAHATRRFRQDVAAAGRLGLSSRRSSTREDHERFHRDMYVPHVRERHGDRALVSSVGKQYHDWVAHHGELLLLGRDGREVAGVVIAFAGRVCFMGEEGISPDAVEVVDPRRLQVALKRAAYERARERGCRVLHFGRSLAQETDSGFRSKQRWGAAVVPPERAVYPEWTFVWRVPSALTARVNAAGLVRPSEAGGEVLVAGPGGASCRPLGRSHGDNADKTLPRGDLIG